MTETGTIISIEALVIIASLIVAVLTLRHTLKKDAAQQAADNATMRAEINGNTKAVDKLTSMSESTQKSISTLGERIAVVERDQNATWHAINAIKGNTKE